MSLTQRQEHILENLIREYLSRAEPISSGLLKERCKLPVSPATIRNELQELAEKGYIEQPHTSAGRVPTQKAYQYFVEKLFSEHQSFPRFVMREIEVARERIEQELRAAEELADSLRQMLLLLSHAHVEEDVMLKIITIIGPSKTTYQRNISLIEGLITFFDTI